ncbi:type I polyketide synthase [Chondromyces crocatus]|uniref:Polyketide synthase n=1 Tax=Chondromyces crocatus TaxID=52 RepID=B1GYG1_CHOCO|nr:type I polyketide synthase [Chondromyces crocatus]AKT41315.1 uncharacterized protein CMC5_054890 [Chondromyces crocatus]CAQ18834.1 polyketide synthase [Chondromyces crocatus]
MSRQGPSDPADLSAQKRALLALKKLQTKLDTMERAATEPIAIVGASCRFPGGADDLPSFWRLLHEGHDAVRDVPPGRWSAERYYDPDPQAAGKTYTRSAGFLERVDGFDALFFGISPREAARMDPQQRLLLEVAWEALEDAGHPPSTLTAQRTGVFLGIGVNDYIQLGGADPSKIDAYDGTGNGFCFAAGRISYALGLNGPSLAIDTACSSSLVALHIAAQSLRASECRVALVAGVQLLLSPLPFVFLSRLRALAPDGRCKTFDAAADGYGRGEGAAAIVLKRLSDARADGDRILALVRGSAINHDGASSGFTVPNGLAQRTLLRSALAAAGAAPSDIDYVEAHGTGTRLGDPIELDALAEVLGDGRAPDRPLLVGSAKTNVGHLEAAAGLVGLLKVVLALEHGEIPAHLHFRTPSPLIGWDALPVRVAAERTPWPRLEGRRLAGVSSFGLSGTNAHVVLEAAPPPAPRPVLVDRSAHAITLSARSPEALRALAGRYTRFLAQAPLPPLGDIAFTANAGRTHLRCRSAFVGTDVDELCRAISAYAGGEEAAISGTCGRDRPRIAFLFTGQGAQYPGMGRDLYEREPVFREAIDRCDAICRPLLPASLCSVLFAADGEATGTSLDDTLYTQPALFALEYALTELWRSFGVTPQVVMGHSVGEIAAACVAGVLNLEDALRLVCERSRRMHALPPGGAMAAIAASEAHVVEALANVSASVSVAAVNGPSETVISGAAEVVAERIAWFVSHGIKAQPLAVSHAFHSPQMDPILDDFQAAIAGLSYSPPQIGFISNLTGRPAESGQTLDAAYWRRHARAPVRFAAGMAALAELQIDVFVEVGPRPTLLGMGRRSLPDHPGAWLPSLRKGQDEQRQILTSLTTLHVRGAPVDWAAYDHGRTRRRVALPTYPFERERYWIEQPDADLADHPSAKSTEEPDRIACPPVSDRNASVSSGPLVETNSDVVRRLRTASPARRRHLLATHVASEVARVLGFDPARPLDPALGFFELGMDSLLSVELRGRLQKSLGCALPTTVAFDYPSVDALTAHLARNVLDLEGRAPPITAAAIRRDEPVAIIGMACRFPGGANNVDAYWRLLRDGADATHEVPRDRWDVDAYYDPDPDAPGKMISRRGGFVQGIGVDMFDASFFHISPREAVTMDPQQRILLETTWEALEDAGQIADRLVSSRTAVMLGIASNDYAALLGSSEGSSTIDGYALTGNAASCAAGRISFILGLQGPCLSVDTSCSSSLVATHLACQALRNGEAELAIAGGANLILLPEVNVMFSRLRALSPDGRCKAFDASANGYVRGEGAGIVILKRLSDALRDGDRIHAVLRGSAVNHDGRSSGLTVPNGPAQQAVIRQALASAGVSPAQVGHIEAHGTGTPLGDPIEVQSIAAVLGEGRPASSPVLLGTAKANIGHLEAGAGVAGLIKAALCVKHGEIPSNPLFETPSPKIPWADIPVVVPTELTAWPAIDGPRTTGVSSFGMSGTNAHVVLTEPPLAFAPEPFTSGSPPLVHLLPISARSPEALRALATAYRDALSRGALSGDDVLAHDVCFTAGTRRTHHLHRLAVRGASREDLVAGLDAALTNWSSSASPARGRKLAFMFSGHNSQWVGMARGLLDEPVFAEALGACSRALAPYLGESLLDLLASGEDRYHEMHVVHPALFSVQVALAALWRSWGVEPDAVVGHSFGEIAAAHVSGALSLDDAARVIGLRSVLYERLRTSGPRGAMASVELSTDDARAAIADMNDRVFIAVSTGPTSSVLSGEATAVEQVVKELEQRGIFGRLLRVSIAGHSPHVEPLREELVAGLQGIEPRQTAVPMFSTVLGQYIDGEALDADYWGRNLRDRVRFWDALQGLAEDGFDAFLEVSPHPVLQNAVEQGLHQLGRDGLALPSLRRDEPERPSLLDTLGALYTAGYPIEFGRLFPSGGRVVDLPTYRFQRTRHWIETPTRNAPAGQTSARGPRLLGERITSARSPGEHYLALALAPAAFPLLKEYVLRRLPLVSPAVLLGIAWAAAAEVLDVSPTTGPDHRASPLVLEDVALHTPWVVPQEGPRHAQLILSSRAENDASFEIFSSATPGGPWQRHAAGRSRRLSPDEISMPAPVALAEIRARCAEELTGEAFLDGLAAGGLALGPGLRCVERVWRRPGEVLGLFKLSERGAAEAGALRLHPALLDNALHLLEAASSAENEGTRIAATFERVRIAGQPGAVVWGHARLREENDTPPGTVTGDVSLLDEAGRAFAELAGVTLTPAPRTLVGETARHCLDTWSYEIRWEAMARTPPRRPVEKGAWLVLADRGGLGEAAADQLTRRGHVALLATSGPREALGGGRFHIDPASRADLAWLLDHARGAGPAVRGVVHLLSLDAPPTEALTLETLVAAQQLGCATVPPLVQALLDAALPISPQLWLITRGAQPAGGAPEPLAVAQAPLWGIGRIAALEHPELWGGLLDLDPHAPSGAIQAEAARVVDELLGPDGEDLLALRGAERRVARLIRSPALPLPAERPGLRPDATYLITGGLHGLGLEVARWMVEAGARHLVLTGRRGLPDPTADGAAEIHTAIANLERAGASIRIVAADASNLGQMEALFADIARHGPPLAGIVHAAGTSRPALLAQTDQAAVEFLLAPKVQGAWILDHLTRELDLDFLVLFSSAAAVWGGGLLGPYAAANHFLDAIAHHRRALGRTALSINWGSWQAGSMLTHMPEDARRYLEGIGFGTMPLDEALEVLGWLLGTPLAQRAIASIDWGRFKPIFEARRRRPLLDLIEAPAANASPAADELLLRRLEADGPEARMTRLIEHTRRLVTETLQLEEPAAFDLDQGFFQLGMDSIMSVQIRKRLEADLGRRLPPTLAFDHPSVRRLATYLATEILAPTPETAAPPSPDASSAPSPTGSETAPDPLDALTEDELVALLAAELWPARAGLSDARSGTLSEGPQRPEPHTA